MADKSYGIAWQREVGLNHTPAYEVSGQPFAQGNVNATDATRVVFPYVTRWVQVSNHGTTAVKVGFSEIGVSGSNYFRVHGTDADANSAPQSVRLELKVSEIWLYGSDAVDVVAGLTSISPGKTSTDSGASWSGSSGVG
jgi:hypothetical protein